MKIDFTFISFSHSFSHSPTYPHVHRTSGDLRLSGINDLLIRQDYESRSAEFTYPLYTDELCVVVKKASKVPTELLPLVIFDEILWLSLFIAGFTIGTVWSVLRHGNSQLIDAARHQQYYNLSPWLSQQSKSRKVAQIFIDTFLLLLSIPFRRFPRIQTERLMLASICLSSMIFVSMYQSKLSTVFVKPIYFKDITTLEQLDKSGQQILVKYAGFLDDVFPNDSTPTYKSLRGKMKLSSSDKGSMELVIDGSQTATITRKTTTKHDNSIYFIRNQLHLIDRECPKKYFVAYMMPFNSPFARRLNEILQDIERFGFIDKWINDFDYESSLENIKNLSFESTQKVLSLDDLKFPFIALGCGTSIGFLTFFVEKCLKRMPKRRRRKKRVKYKLSIKSQTKTPTTEEELPSTSTMA